MRRPGASVGVAAVAAVGLTGCLPHSGCGAGYAPGFDLSVRSSATPSPSVRFCERGRCTPVPGPTPVPIPGTIVDVDDLHSAVVHHVAEGTWRVALRGDDREPPSHGTVELYRDGALVATRTVHLRWPDVDPCRASNPPAPHVTIEVG